jgi:hypothetical protein
MQSNDKKTIIMESDIKENETVKFTSDVYSMTICGIITDSASPMQLSFAIQQCLIVFVIQMFLPIAFYYYNTAADPKAVPLTGLHSVIRICCALVLHTSVQGDVKSSMQNILFMKRVGSNKIPQNKRFMCCLLGVL